jgi:hypothetical protein
MTGQSTNSPKMLIAAAIAEGTAVAKWASTYLSLNIHGNLLKIMPVHLTQPKRAFGRANLARKVVQVYDGTFALGGVTTSGWSSAQAPSQS